MVADPKTAYLFNLLYFPATWSESVNTDVYQFVTYILQTAQANNVTIGGGVKYNVPSGQATIDETFLSGAAVPQNSTSYSVVAISGADNFNDDDVTIKDLFDAVVNITREITPTCEFPVICLYPLVPLTRPDPSSRNHLESWVGNGHASSDDTF